MKKINSQMVEAFASAMEGANTSKKMVAAIRKGVAVVKAADRRRERAEEIGKYLVSLGYTPKGRIVKANS